MMSFTADGQLDPALLQQRDEALSTDTTATRESRAHMAAGAPSPHPAAVRGLARWDCCPVVLPG